MPIRENLAFVQPALLSCKNGLNAKYVHDVEVFRSVATLVAYDGLEDLIAITRRGLGSLVASVFSSDASFTRDTILGIGDLHGRVLAVIPAVGPNTLATATSCRAVCTAAQEELEAARNSPACAPVCSTIDVSSCRDRRIASSELAGFCTESTPLYS